ncbi:MAG: hypothetical protein H7835_12810 [Magnetococcus sp. XQGC-1]
MIRFLEAAQRELDEAVLFHEAHACGLGRMFLAEVLAAMELAAIRRPGIPSVPTPGVAVCGVFLVG